jgi:hypothetical protein
MSHSRAIRLRFAIIDGMSRCGLLVLCSLGILGVAACSKSAGNQDKLSSPPAAPAAPAADVIPVPQGGAGMANAMGGAAQAAPETAAAPSGGDDQRLRLKPEEGKLAIEPPADAKAGSESVARIVVTPGKGYHVNLEFPVKLTLTPPAGITLAKDKFTAGGRDKAKGDADALDDNQLAFSVKLTPAASGDYTINGTFKFAVCDPAQCLAKQETIAIAVAAK